MIKILEQISNDEFRIKVEKQPNETEIVIQHDFIGIYKNGSVETDKQVAQIGENYKTLSKWLNVFCKIQIPIRDFTMVILPLLEKSKFTKKEHLLNPDKSPNYTWNKSVIKYYDKELGQSMVAFREKGKEDYVYMSLSVYEEHYNNKNP